MVFGVGGQYVASFVADQRIMLRLNPIEELPQSASACIAACCRAIRSSESGRSHARPLTRPGCIAAGTNCLAPSYPKSIRLVG